MPVSAESGLTKKSQRGRQRGRGPAGNTGSQKIYFTPVQKPVFQARTIHPVEKEIERDRQDQVGGGEVERGGGLMTQ